MKRFTILVMTFAVLGLSWSLEAQAGTLDEIQNSGKIRIGYREAEPPMSFHDKDGKPIGYTIDLCSRIATAVKNKLGMSEITIQFVPVTAETRFSALSDNSIDILCGSTTKTLSRSELVDFTQLTFVTGASLLSAKKAPVVGIGDLQGKKVAVVEGTTTIEVLNKTLKDSLTEAEVVAVDTAAAGIGALREGKVDAYASDQVVLIGLLLTSEDRDNFVVSNELFSFEPFALAVRRNDADFRLVADRVISQLNRTGQINQIYKKWFGVFSEKQPILLQALYRLNATPE
jgi:ABC-type amino acid transport substrate-binding protein